MEEQQEEVIMLLTQEEETNGIISQILHFEDKHGKEPGQVNPIFFSTNG